VKTRRACGGCFASASRPFRTEEERFGNLWICPAINDEPRDLELAPRERFDAGPVELGRAGAAVDAMAKASQFAFGGAAISERAAGLKAGGGVL
jgi:hypothetical protein